MRIKINDKGYSSIDYIIKFDKKQSLAKFGYAKWNSGNAAVKYRAYARCEVKCATHAHRRFTMRSIASRT